MTGAGSPAGVVAPGRPIAAPGFATKHPALWRALLTVGRHRRAGHDRQLWADVDWEQLRAHVGIGRRVGAWQVRAVHAGADDASAWIAAAEEMPHQPGWYTALVHDERGVVMSDLRAELAGCLPVLRRATGRVLVSGLGLGIVPAAVLRRPHVTSVDVVELDEQVIDLVAGDPAARDNWAADPRLHVHHGDAHRFTWPPGTRWDVAWHDIWDTITPGNLASMAHLHRRYGHRVGWQGSWEHAECVAMRRRHQSIDRAAVLDQLSGAGFDDLGQAS